MDMIARLPRLEDRMAAIALRERLEDWNIELKRFFAANRIRVEILRVPMPIPRFDKNDPVWPSYTNLLQIRREGKKTLIVPSYKSVNGSDIFPLQSEVGKIETRIQVLLEAKGFTVKWVNATKLINHGGSIHCATANVPMGI